MSDRTAVIYIAPMGSVPRDFIGPLAKRVLEVYETPVKIRTPGFDWHSAFDGRRNQYNSTTMLEALHGDTMCDDCKVVGVIDVDLFVPVLTFVFGEAELGGRVAIASSFRLHNSFYGLPENEELVVERLEKEVNHELGHTFGLVHCENPTCVMHASTAVEEVDLKASDLCRACRRSIGMETTS